MKIGPLDPKLTPASTQTTERRGSAPASSQPSAEPSAKVELSSATALRADEVEDAAFDKAKVERIANAIREGRFEVDAGAIADKLISNAQEVLSRARN